MTLKLKEFIKLGWKLMEHKFNYYILDNPTIDDKEYDLIERRYDQLSKELNLEPTAANMVGFKEDRPSSTLVRRKAMSSNLGGKEFCKCGKCEWS